jgi:hypothetical protein
MKERAIGRTTRPPSPEKSSPSDELQRRRDRELDELLDEALKDTFPASDPVSISLEPARCPSDVAIEAADELASIPSTNKGSQLDADDHGSGQNLYLFQGLGHTGQPIVFSHGWPLTADAWNEQMMFLVSEGCRQCRRGLGFTNPPRRLANIAASAAEPVAVQPWRALHTMAPPSIGNYVLARKLSVSFPP